MLGQAIAELSLAHTLETAVARVSELLRADRVAIYLGDASRLRPEDGAGADAELAVAERLLELAFGPLRAQGVLHVVDAQADTRLAPVRTAVAEARIDAALAVPLVAREELVGLLAVYLPRGREVEPNDAALLSALAAQLAVAAQNAELHERTERQAAELQKTIASERKSGKRLRALYEISGSFAQSLSLDATLDSVTTAAVELLEVDAAVIRVLDGRGDTARSARPRTWPMRAWRRCAPCSSASRRSRSCRTSRSCSIRRQRDGSARRTSCSSRSSSRARPRSSSRSPPRQSCSPR